MLEAREVVGAYGAVEVVKGVSLTVRAGELVTLLGPNGAGKTTFLKMVVGLLPCRSGQITLNGDDIGGLSPPAILARKVALVPEGRQIFGPLTVLENLELGAYHRRKSPGRAGPSRGTSPASTTSSPCSRSGTRSPRGPCRVASSRWWPSGAR